MTAAHSRSLWRLTSHKIGRRFLGLDVAGNVLLYPMYGASRLGGWSAATVAMNPTEDGDEQRPNVMISGRPVHWKAAKVLEGIVRRDLQRKAEDAARAAGAARCDASDVGEAKSTSASSGGMATGEEEVVMPTGKQLRKRLRLNRLVTWGYKALYWAIVGFIVYVGACACARFRCWLNPPARSGLDGIFCWLLAYPIAAWCTVKGGIPQDFAEAATDFQSMLHDAINDLGGFPKTVLGLVLSLWPDPCSAQGTTAAAPADRLASSRRKRLQPTPEELAYAEAVAEHRQVFWRRALIAFLSALVMLLFL
jgi:hypothetical protein